MMITMMINMRGRKRKYRLENIWLIDLGDEMDWVQEPSPIECVIDEEINIWKRTKLTYKERSMNERNVEKTLRMPLNSRAEWVYMMKQVQHAMTAPSTWVNQELGEYDFDIYLNNVHPYIVCPPPLPVFGPP
ncbi:hypothetical protein Tco_1139027 [Tanacetum coccineum]